MLPITADAEAGVIVCAEADRMWRPLGDLEVHRDAAARAHPIGGHQLHRAEEVAADQRLPDRVDLVAVVGLILLPGDLLLDKPPIDLLEPADLRRAEARR